MTGQALTCGHRATPSVATRLRLGALDATILEADRMALALRAALERITIPLACAAQAFVRKKVWFPFGHARVADHARERFGRSGRWVCDRAVLGRALARPYRNTLSSIQ